MHTVDDSTQESKQDSRSHVDYMVIPWQSHGDHMGNHMVTIHRLGDHMDGQPHS